MRQKNDETRMDYLARVLCAFMDMHGIAAECTIIYDDAVCDGHCLAQDIANEVGVDVWV